MSLVVGLAASYFMVQALFANGVFIESPRMQLESAILSKVGWFFFHPLPNALALFALRDDFGTGAAVFWCAAATMVGLIGMGFSLTAKGTGSVLSRKWLWCLLVLPLLAHAVSLAAAERSTGYRVLFPLSGVVLVYAIYGLRVLATARNVKPLAHYITLGLLAAQVLLHSATF